jgi:hypothetical protein
MEFTISDKYSISTYKSHKLTLKVIGVQVVEIFLVYLVKDSYKQADNDKWYCFATILFFFTGTNATLGYPSSSSKIT